MDYLYHIMSWLEKTEEGLLSRCEAADEDFRAWVEVEVRPPGLEITAARAQIAAGGPKQADLKPALERLKGVRVGPGMTKIVSGVLADSSCPRLGELFLEAMETIINGLTRPLLRDFHGRLGRPSPGPNPDLNQSVLDEAGRRELLSQNPRLAGSCAAFPREE